MDGTGEDAGWSLGAPDIGLAAALDGLCAIDPARWVPPGESLTWDGRCGGPGWEISAPGGRAFLQGGQYDDQIRLDLIVVERKGHGLGTAIMESLKSHADEQGLELSICQVENWPFFARFPWLDPERTAEGYVMACWYQPERPRPMPS